MGSVPHTAEVTVEQAGRHMKKQQRKEHLFGRKWLVKIPEVILEQTLEEQAEALQVKMVTGKGPPVRGDGMREGGVAGEGVPSSGNFESHITTGAQLVWQGRRKP